MQHKNGKSTDNKQVKVSFPTRDDGPVTGGYHKKTDQKNIKEIGASPPPRFKKST